MRVVLIQNSGSEITTDDSMCVSCSPLGAFVICISDTHAILDVHGKRWGVPIAELVLYMQTQGEVK